MSCKLDNSTNVDQLEKKLTSSKAQRRSYNDVSTYLVDCDSIGLKNTAQEDFSGESETVFRILGLAENYRRVMEVHQN